MILRMNKKEASETDNAAAAELRNQEEEKPEEGSGGGQVKNNETTEELLAKLQEAENKATENFDKYLRSAAEFDNYRKRSVREKADAINYGNEKLLQDVLPLLDSMDRALEQTEKSGDLEAFKMGLQMLREQFLSFLRKHGVESIETERKDFDPNLHEAMMQVESLEHEHNRIVGEFEKGYLLKGRLLRPAKVSVCKRPAAGGENKNDCEDA